MWAYLFIESPKNNLRTSDKFVVKRYNIYIWRCKYGRNHSYAKNLLLIRRAVGWTAEEFGEKIGVTRQTINNIESGRNKLTKTQYIAMRSVLDAEMI